MSLKLSVFVAVTTLFSGAAAAQEDSSGPLAPTDLKCEYLTDPMGMDIRQPRFFWIPQHPGRGQSQTACQILVSTRPGAPVGDSWDSGRVESGQFTHVPYPADDRTARPLSSTTTYYWRVRYWDKQGRASPYSRPARFETGLLDSAEWKGRWIGGGNQLRKEFVLPAKPARARAYVAGLGYYELRINGRKIGDRVLDPARTNYPKRILYATYDITDELTQGANAAGVMLGQGWFRARAALLQIHIELPNGQRLEVLSDRSWKSAQGPILSDSIYDGEVYDARKETPGWDRPGYQDQAWKPAEPVATPAGTLSAQLMPPIRVIDDIVPFQMSSPRPGVFVYDLGQNFSGWVRLRVRGPRGTLVRIRHAELLNPDGTLNTANLRSARATDVYILRGDEEEEFYEPRFTYHGFRYVELAGFPGVPALDSVRGRLVHTAVKSTGGFAGSAPILNQIQRLVQWGIKTNLHGVPTDCNQRDERLGWLADAHLAAESAMLNFDMASFYTKFLRDIRDSQTPEGYMGDVVPDRGKIRPADPAWGSAYPLLVWYMYEQYGDRRILEEHFAGIKAWADHLRSRSNDGIFTESRYGDWVGLDPTPGSLVVTFYYYWSVDIVARAAGVLGKSPEAEAYRRLAEEIKAAFHRKFYNADSGSYGNGSQTSNVLALFLDLAPASVRGLVINSLRNDIVYNKNTHLSTGIVGAKYLFPLLTRIAGPDVNSDLAYELVTQTTYPSWGYMLEQGATTLWELWQNKTGPAMNSHNHPMFGSIGAWFYRALGGIEHDPAQPGYRRIRIAPQAPRDLRWVSASIQTVRGPVVSSWSRGEDSLRLEVTVPVGSEAQIHLPKLNFRNVTVQESGHAVWTGGAYRPGAPGITSATETRGAIVVEAGSGAYRFEVREN